MTSSDAELRPLNQIDCLPMVQVRCALRLGRSRTVSASSWLGLSLSPRNSAELLRTGRRFLKLRALYIEPTLFETA